MGAGRRKAGGWERSRGVGAQGKGPARPPFPLTSHCKAASSPPPTPPRPSLNCRGSSTARRRRRPLSPSPPAANSRAPVPPPPCENAASESARAMPRRWGRGLAPLLAGPLAGAAAAAPACGGGEGELREKASAAARWARSAAFHWGSGSTTVRSAVAFSALPVAAQLKASDAPAARSAESHPSSASAASTPRECSAASSV